MDDLDDHGTEATPGAEIWRNWGQEHLRSEVDRLAGDAVLHRELKLAGFVGPTQRQFEEAVAKYALAVIAAWLHQGVIEEKCKERRLKGLPVLQGIELSADDVEELTMGTVTRAIEGFRVEVLQKGKWDPTKKASLRTFFVGQCLIRYIDFAGTWKAQKLRREAVERPFDEASTGRFMKLAGVEADVIEEETFAEWLAPVTSSRARAALVMQFRGWSVKEIADEQGTTTKAVEGLLGRAKRQIRQDRRHTG